MNTFDEFYVDSGIEYLSLEEIINVHDTSLDASGGLHGIREEGLLKSIITSIQNDDYYPTIVLKLAHLIFSINKYHCFVDGNKRTSLSAGYLFLILNGWTEEYCLLFHIFMEEVVLWLAENIINKNDLEILLSIYLSDSEDYCEANLLDIHWQHIYKTSNEYFFGLQNKIKQLNEKINSEVLSLEEKQLLKKSFDKDEKMMQKIEEIFSLTYHR